MLTLNNITASRNERSLFKGLSISLIDRSILTIKGENGSGKTSLLSIIAGILQPDDGEILYANEKVIGENYPEYCDIILYVGHKNAVKPQLSVRENIKFWAELKGVSELVKIALDYFDLNEIADVPCGRLSAGMQRRVALARLLVSKSDIWLLDEPFTNLDESMKYKLASLISARCERGGIAIIASHEDVPITNVIEINLKDFA